MTRNAFWMVLLLPGVIACGSSPSGPGSTAGDGGTGGDGGGTGGINGTCSSPDNTQGICQWPQYCLEQHCISPQNVNAQGQDIPANACTTQSSSLQGAGNLDTDRADEDAGLEHFAPLSAIITTLQQVAIQDDQGCATLIGHNTTEYEESASGCMGGNPDRAGVPICAAGEAAIMFTGYAYDPQGRFIAKEVVDAGPSLDSQFYWMVGAQAPMNFMDPYFGAVQSGFIIPQTGWTKYGGQFVMAQCLDKKHYPLTINSYPVTLHFADTGANGASVPGNSFCTSWNP